MACVCRDVIEDHKDETGECEIESCLCLQYEEDYEEDDRD